MANRYEAVVVLDPALTDADVTQQLEKIETTIKAHSGAVEKQDVWGRRELAYKIQKKTHGIYSVLIFSGDNSLVTDLRRQLKINDAILRSLIVEKNKFAPDMTRSMHQESAPYRDQRGGDEGFSDSEESSAKY